jgi:hypothetical protein
MRAMIGEFQDARVSAANLNWELMSLERDRQALRKKISEELQGEGFSKTQANDQARTQPEYVKASQEIENKTREWECALAFAERTRLMVEVLLLETANRGRKDGQAIELRRMQQALERRIRQLDG